MSRLAAATPAHLGFATFGGLWGAWGAALPALRSQAGVTDAQLGAALLVIAAGALPAMAVTGRLSDRHGRRVPATALVGLALSGVAVAATAHGPLTLSAGLAALGAASGAADVSINAVAGELERSTGRPVVTRAHAAFSAAVVAGSLVTGLLVHLGAPLVTPFALVVVASVVAAAALVRASAAGGAPPRVSRVGAPLARRPLLLAAGAVAALGFAVENAHQSWGAVYLGDELGVGPGATAAAPALFAGVGALTRLVAGRLSHLRPVVLLVAGGLVGAAGTVVLATAATVAVGLAGLAVAAAGTAVLFPTLLRAATADVDERARGRATSVVATTGYVGYLVGPVLVGQVADTGGLRVAMLAVAGVAAVFTVAAVPLCSRLSPDRPLPARAGSATLPS